MFDKYRQINRFIELIDDVAPKIPGRAGMWWISAAEIVFNLVVYYYFTKILKRSENHRVDLKKDVIEKCNRLALEYGYEGCPSAMEILQTIARKQSRT